MKDRILSWLSHSAAFSSALIAFWGVMTVIEYLCARYGVSQEMTIAWTSLTASLLTIGLIHLGYWLRR